MAAQPPQPEVQEEEAPAEEAPAAAAPAAAAHHEQPEAVEEAAEEEEEAAEAEAEEEAEEAAPVGGEKKLEKFGVQTEKGRVLLLFRNGDKVRCMWRRVCAHVCVRVCR